MYVGEIFSISESITSATGINILTATATITDDSGNVIATADVINSITNSGGTPQTVAYVWDTTGKPAGRYVAAFTITVQGGEQRILEQSVILDAAPSTDYVSALDELSRICDATVEPILSRDDLHAILDATARARVWKPSTVCYVGEHIVPTVPNGYIYRVVQAGVSGPTEPNWYTPPILSYTGSWQQVAGLTYPVVDGTAVVVLEAPARRSLWNVKAAARQGWLVKAARCAATVDVTLGTDKFVWSQLHSHCQTMADRFKSASLI